jgi:hypothetical protein
LADQCPWLRRLTEQPDAEFDIAMARAVDLFAEPPAGGPGSIVVVRTTRDLDAVLPALRGVLGDPD